MRAESELGVTADGRLRPCPDKPNCVCTFASDSRHHMDGVGIHGSIAEAQAKVVRVVAELPRTTLISQKDGYLHFEFRTRLMRFVDDVEFLFDASSKTMHFRSASRIGYSDFGVNRARMQDLKERLIAAGI